MTVLHELQQEIALAILGSNTDNHDLPVRNNGLTVAQRLQIYRNNIFHGFTEALRACYPVIERLVGMEFFNYAAMEYIRKYPSTSGDLHAYGHLFPVFLSHFQAVQELPYLPDVARLEWARQLVYHAADTNSLDVAMLQNVPEEQYGELRFQINPSAQLLTSEYPILRIWEVNQEDYTGDYTVELTRSGNSILVIRRDFLIEMVALSPCEHQFLHALANNQTLMTACELALSLDSGFDVQACLCHHVTQQTLTNIQL